MGKQEAKGVLRPALPPPPPKVSYNRATEHSASWFVSAWDYPSISSPGGPVQKSRSVLP